MKTLTRIAVENPFKNSPEPASSLKELRNLSFNELELRSRVQNAPLFKTLKKYKEEIQEEQNLEEEKSKNSQNLENLKNFLRKI